MLLPDRRVGAVFRVRYGADMRLAEFIRHNVEAILADWEAFAATLIPAAAAVAPPAPPVEAEPQPKKPQEEEYDADSVFAKLKGLKAPSENE